MYAFIEIIIILRDFRPQKNPIESYVTLGPSYISQR